MSLQVNHSAPTSTPIPDPVPERTHPPGRATHTENFHPHGIRYTELHTSTTSDGTGTSTVEQCLPRAVGGVCVERGLESKLEGPVWCPERRDPCTTPVCHIRIRHQRCACWVGSWGEGERGGQWREGTLGRYLPLLHSHPTPDLVCLSLHLPCPIPSPFHVSFIVLYLCSPWKW